MTTYFSEPRKEHLVDMLDWVASEHGAKGMHFPAQKQSETYRSLADKIAQVAGGLVHHGVQPGQVVGILFSSCIEFVISYFAVVRAHAVVAPLPGLLSIGGLDPYLARLQTIAADSDITHIVLEDAFAPLVAKGAVSERVTLLSFGELLNTGTAAPDSAISPDALAMIQYTSGSTASPKGVPLLHRNIIAGLRAISVGMDLSSDDVNGQWLPLFHDMGLIGMLSGMGAGVNHYIWPPLFFIKSPVRFLKEFARHKATIYAGPNFSYAYLRKHAAPRELADMDLSAWRVAFNGAEPIDPTCMQKFIEHFRPAGFRPQTMYPVYGLAEATLAVSFPALGTEPRVEWVDKHTLANDRKVVHVPAEHPHARGVVAVGNAVRGVEIAIAEPDGDALELCGERRVGEVLVRGEPVIRSYYRREHESAQYLRGDWFRTGDLGYISNGELFVTGRVKQMIIANGVNYYPEDIEAVLRHEDGVYSQRLVAFAIDADGVESIAVLVESQATGQAAQDLAALLHEKLVSSFGVSCFSVYIMPRRAICRTTSGKVQRILMRNLLRSSELDHQITARFPAGGDVAGEQN